SLVFPLNAAPTLAEFGTSTKDTGNSSGLVVTRTTFTLQRVETSAFVELSSSAVLLGARTCIALRGHLLFNLAFILAELQPFSTRIAAATVSSSFFSLRSLSALPNPVTKSGILHDAFPAKTSWWRYSVR